MALAGQGIVGDLFHTLWQKETTDICRIVTQRDEDGKLNPGVLEVRDHILNLASEFNNTQQTLKFEEFQWKQDYDGSTSFSVGTNDDIIAAKYYLFGLRLGRTDAPYKIAIICHLDTVPADATSTEWDPFHPHVEQREYEVGTESPQDFLVGRGCLDDKGPAISAFIVARALAKKYDTTAAFENVAFEVLFDSSEETDMATPNYLEDPAVHAPHYGIVFDAFWCTRAEKGGERPTFTAGPMPAPTNGELYVKRMISNPTNSGNTIPDWAEAEIACNDATKLATFADEVGATYKSYVFDDPEYRRAEMEVSTGDGVVTLKTLVSGAQHGSSPDENREEGANPVVSLANFLAGQVSGGTFAPSSASAICTFITWMFGTKVYGEKHKPLYEYDNIFTEGNGTTYAITKMTMGEDGSTSFNIDIRFALNHQNGPPWDGVTEGLVNAEYDSTFKRIFPKLVIEFNHVDPTLANVRCDPSTLFVPDIRVPDTNENFQNVEKAFKDVMGYAPPRLAIGGGTDAKGYTNLLAVGPLFSTRMGPPVNYHGINEGAPMTDMGLSTATLYNIMQLEVQNGAKDAGALAQYDHRLKKALANVKMMRRKGFKHCCCDHL